MTRLSVNINKFATLRNARGGNIPNLVEAAVNCEKFGAQGITVHPRPDERHIRYKDVYDLKKVVQTEFNIEGYPNEKFMKMVLEVAPEQVTLVPDDPDVLTSNSGWDTSKNRAFLSEIVQELKSNGIRSSLFMGTDSNLIEGAAKTGTDRIELYTEPYADEYPSNKEQAIAPFKKATNVALQLGLGINAGHDLNRENLHYFFKHIPELDEVSIGHALVADALYLGLENTIQLYRRALANKEED